nr:hypothetical protein [Pandoraea sputorum]
MSTSIASPVPARLKRVLPSESLQHPLSVYDALLEVAARISNMNALQGCATN